MMGLGLALLEALVPVLPVQRAPGRGVRHLPCAVAGDMPEIESVIIENPSVDGPFGAKAIGEMANNAQAPAICRGDPRRGRRVGHPDAGDARARAPRPAATSDEPRREGKRVIFDEEISVRPAISADGGEGFWGVDA